MARRVIRTEVQAGLLRQLWLAGVGATMRLDNWLAGSPRAERYWSAMRAVGSDGRPQLFLYRRAMRGSAALPGPACRPRHLGPLLAACCSQHPPHPHPALSLSAAPTTASAM